MKMTLVLTMVGLLTGGSDSTQMRGVWKAVEVTFSEPAMTITPGPNLSIFAGTHYTRTLLAGDQSPVTDPAHATADQLRAAWGSFVGESGTYQMAAVALTLRPMVAKSGAAVGKPIVYSYRFVDNDTLLVTTVSDRHGPVAHPETIKLVRVE